jgi:diguanylate cyclase (GGDEF)-like protein
VIQAVSARQRSHQQRSFDSLTGLPNRRLFALELERGIGHASPRHSRFAVMIVDLDHFKELNETVGFAAGDAVLRAVAERLVDLRRPADLLARFGDDDFAFLLSDFARDTEVERLAREIVGTVGRPLDFSGHELLVTASVGASLYPWDGEDAATLLRNAETAVHAAKRLGRSRAQLYAATLGTADFGTMELKTALRHAVEEDQLEVLLQPQVHAESDVVRGVEALTYWRHPVRGRIPPAGFIGLAERIGMIVPIGEWVLRRACAAVAGLRSAYGGLTLAVNVSAIQLRERDFVRSVAQSLEATGLPAEALELEVTESAAMIDVEATLATLRDLSRLGVSISIDDFGTGYSSLEYLQRFPIHTLKIDHSFVRELPDNAESSAIVQAILALAAALRLEVVAEGVESPAQADLLRRQGCQYLQGYLFAHPLTRDELVEWLDARGAAASENQAPGAG